MSNTNSSGEHRDAFPSLNDSEYHEMLRTDEAVAVLSVYLEQRVAGLFDGHDPGVQRQYEHNPNFPFPIGPTAYEIAELVVKSSGSFGMDRPKISNTDQVEHQP